MSAVEYEAAIKRFDRVFACAREDWRRSSKSMEAYSLVIGASFGLSMTWRFESGHDDTDTVGVVFATVSYF